MPLINLQVSSLSAVLGPETGRLAAITQDMHAYDTGGSDKQFGRCVGLKGRHLFAGTRFVFPSLPCSQISTVGSLRNCGTAAGQE